MPMVGPHDGSTIGSGDPDPAHLTPERWQRIKEIFGQVLELNQQERETFLERACGSDENMLKEVKSLLASNERDPDTAMVFHLVNPTMEEEPLLPHGDTMIDRTIGSYRIIRKIAWGGM